MKFRNSVFAAAALAATILGSAASAAPGLTGEQRLAKELAGRVPGEPVSCIYLPQVRSTKIIDKTAIIYDAGQTIYVNRPADPQWLDSHDVLVTRPHGPELCSVDIVRLYDSGMMGPRGSIGLGQFVPYRKAS